MNEIPEQMFQTVIYQLLWDYYIGVIIFWLNDKSEMFSNTDVLVDKTLDLFCSLLKAGTANKVFDIASYLFKSHILSRLEGFKNQSE